MLKAFNKHYDMIGNILVNVYNSTANDRGYDPTAVGSQYMPENPNNTTTPTGFYWNSTPPLFTKYFSSNGHTANNLAGFHENRFIPRCTYGFNTETFPGNK